MQVFFSHLIVNAAIALQVATLADLLKAVDKKQPQK